MDKSAIEQIAGMATAAAINVFENEALKGNAVLVHKDTVIVPTEQFSPLRRRFRGVMSTTSLDDFVGHVEHRAATESDVLQAGIKGFIDATNLSATVFFNIGDAVKPGHADDIAKLKLEKTAPYKAICDINGKKLSQADTVDFLRDWATYLTAMDQNDEDGKEIPLASAIAAVRKIKISAKAETTSAVSDFKQTRSAMDEVEASAASDAMMPGYFVFECEPYLGLPSRKFSLRLSINADAGEPCLRLRIDRAEAEIEAIARDFKNVLNDGLSSVAVLTIGTFTP